MGKTQVAEKDKPDLERLEAIVQKAGHEGMGTADLSKESGIKPPRIRDLFNNHFSRVARKIDTASKGGIPADLWVYTPTMFDIARPHQS